MGPAFKEIAAKYKGNADAPAKLQASLSSGEGTSGGQGERRGHKVVGQVDIGDVICREAAGAGKSRRMPAFSRGRRRCLAL